MQIKDPMIKSDFLHSRKHNWPFSQSVQGKKSNPFSSGWWSTSAVLPLILIFLAFIFVIIRKTKQEPEKAPWLWVCYLCLDEIPCTTSPNLMTIFYFSPSQKHHRTYGWTNEQTHGTYFLWWLSLNQGLNKEGVRKPQIFIRNNIESLQPDFKDSAIGVQLFFFILILVILISLQNDGGFPLKWLLLWPISLYDKVLYVITEVGDIGVSLSRLSPQILLAGNPTTWTLGQLPILSKRLSTEGPERPLYKPHLSPNSSQAWTLKTAKERTSN